MSALAPVRAAAARITAPAPPRTATPGAATVRRPDLRVVEERAGVAGRAAFIALVGAILAGGLVALLMLHTLAAQDAFTLHRLQYRTASLNELEQQLAVANQQAAAPSALAAKARALGLVPTSSLRFVHRRNGALVAVSTGVAPVIVAPASPKPAPSASATPAAPSSSQSRPQVKTQKASPVHKRHRGPR